MMTGVPHRVQAANGIKGRMRPLIHLAVWIKTIVDWSGRVIASFCLSFLFVVLLVNVILRYAFDAGIPWAYEIHALLLPWLVSGGIVIAAARGRNIAITLLPEVVGPRTRQFLMLAVETVAFIISISVLISSQPILTAAKYQSYSTLPLKQIWGYDSLIYAFTGMAIIAAVDILRILSGENVIDQDPSHGSLS